jgi:hypothetical protein
MWLPGILVLIPTCGIISVLSAPRNISVRTVFRLNGKAQSVRFGRTPKVCIQIQTYVGLVELGIFKYKLMSDESDMSD